MVRVSAFFMLILTVWVVAACAEATPAPQPASPTETYTPGPADLTSTAIVVAATDTGGFEAESVAEVTEEAPPPPLIAENCRPGQFNSFDSNLSDRIQAEIDAAQVKDAFVSVITTEETDDCITNTLVETLYAVNITVANIDNLAFMGHRAAEVLTAMSEFPPGNDETVTLSLRFDQGEEQRLVEVDYQTALDRVGEGLTGEELIEVLGGLQPG